MKKYLLAGAALFAATNANAAPLISAAVTGPSGTVWNTKSSDTFYTLFLVRPFGNVINPTDNFTFSPTNLGSNNYTTAGDGFPNTLGSTANSDPSYLLTLNFADGATISGQYLGSTFTGGTSARAGNLIYKLTGFGWDRSPADNVSQFRAVSGNNPADYTGQFAFSITDVPEPATWAMLMLGFGAIGGAMRYRRRTATKLAFA